MKKFSKKQLLIGGSALAIIALSGVAFALTRPNEKQHSSTDTKKVATTRQEQTTQIEPAEGVQAQQTTTSTTSEQKPVQQAPVASPEPTPAPANAGEDGIAVSDKTSAMNSAGIASDQQASADTVITRLSNWRYKEDGSKNLCSATPAAKMAKFGADYLTNPVTQLKYCNDYAVQRYGSWANWR